MVADWDRLLAGDPNTGPISFVRFVQTSSAVGRNDATDAKQSLMYTLLTTGTLSGEVSTLEKMLVTPTELKVRSVCLVMERFFSSDPQVHHYWPRLVLV